MTELFIMLKIFEVGIANDISWAWAIVLFGVEFMLKLAIHAMR